MIPRKIHQIFIGTIPEREAGWCQKMKQMNPKWSYTLHGNDLLERFKADPYVRRLTEEKAKTAFIVDRLRILLLAEEGGIYLDTDCCPLRPLDTLKCWDNSQTEFVYGMRNPYRPGVALHRGIGFSDNTVLASAPQGRMIRRLLDCWTPKEIQVTGHRIGLTVLSYADESCLGLGYKYFYDLNPNPEALLLHDGHNAGSWVNKREPLPFIHA